MDNEPAKDVSRHGDGTWKESGNPGGAKKGVKRLRTRLLEEKLAIAGYDPVDALIAVATDKEVSLDIRVRVHLDLMGFIYAKRKPQSDPIDISLGKVKNLEDLAKAQSTIVRNISKGKLSPDNGKVLSDIIELQRKAIESQEFEKRLIALETELKGKRQK